MSEWLETRQLQKKIRTLTHTPYTHAPTTHIHAGMSRTVDQTDPDAAAGGSGGGGGKQEQRTGSSDNGDGGGGGGERIRRGSTADPESSSSRRANARRVKTRRKVSERVSERVSNTVYIYNLRDGRKYFDQPRRPLEYSRTRAYFIPARFTHFFIGRNTYTHSFIHIYNYIHT